mgnify:CR=1 FL=1
MPEGLASFPELHAGEFVFPYGMFFRHDLDLIAGNGDGIAHLEPFRDMAE